VKVKCPACGKSVDGDYMVRCLTVTAGERCSTVMCSDECMKFHVCVMKIGSNVAATTDIVEKRRIK